MPLMEDEFAVPLFLGREAKLFGPFSFRQFVLGALTSIAILLDFIFITPKNFLLSLGIFLLLVFFGYGSAFIKIANKSLPAFFFTFLSFSMAPKRYLWRKKAIKREKIEIFPQVKEESEEEEKHPELKMGGALDNLVVKLETGQKIE